MEIKLYVLTDNDGYIADYKFNSKPINGWKLANETEVNEKTFFSKLVNGKFILDEDRWNEYQELMNPKKD